MQSNRRIQAAIVAIGLAIGVWHLYLASLAIFLFREGEPWTSWVAVLLGPGATLVAVIVCIFGGRIGGMVLVALAPLAFVAFAIGESSDLENMVAFFENITVPVAALGAVVLVLSRTPRAAESAS